jgi:putative tricarboxylic transport membrane protein
VWVSAGLLLNAALITAIGFILSCTLCYLLAVQGLRRAGGQTAVNAPRTWVTDFLVGWRFPRRCSGCSRNSWRSICRA